MSMHNSWQPLGPAVLFTPADRPEWLAKVADHVDMVILNLEGGCRVGDWGAVREAVASYGPDPTRTIVHVNSPRVEDCTADIDILRGTALYRAMLPRTPSAQQVDGLVAAPGKKTQVITLIGTPLGAMRAEGLAQINGVVALFWGAEGLMAGLAGASSRFNGGEVALAPDRIHTGSYHSVAVHTRSHIHLAAAVHGKASLDSICANISDAGELAAEAADAAALGFAATVCIHPDQVPIIRQAYRLSDEEISWARRPLTEAERNTGVLSFDGRMVDASLFR